MMKRFLSAITRHFVRRGQTGQALVVLAIGFIGLLGFVGIVTDVSLLFIRYSTMRRAVDAASVAAAGQMRRVIDETPTDGIAQDEAQSVAQLSLAARQFIELYGLSPTDVLVETCRFQQVPRDAVTEAPLDRDGTALFNSDGTPNLAANQDDVRRYRELCTEDELKVVRVTAQIEAPTIFMRLLGYDTITLTESALSQTAVIDVVLVFDVSESMLNETTYDDWDMIPEYTGDAGRDRLGVRYMPPYIKGYDFGGNVDPYGNLLPSGDPDRTNPWDIILNNGQVALNPLIDTAIDPTDPASPAYNFYDSLVKFEPGATPGTWQAYTGAAGSPEAREEPRTFCRVRAYPNSVFGRSPVPDWLRSEYYGYFGTGYSEQFLNIGGSSDDPAVARNFVGFVPQYDYFGCCNDPDGDFNFDDLVCQPFREARDAAEEFLARLDFLRGDRVAFVTFDRFATIIDPDGNGLQSAMIETEFDLFDTDGTTLLRRGANNTLNAMVGVRAEDSTYYDADNDGQWDSLLDYGTPKTYDGLDGTLIGNLKDNPVRGACPFDSANLWNFWTLHDTLPDGSARPYEQMLLTDIHSVPHWYTGSTSKPSVSYEFRGSCRGTNIGGALRAGADALYATARREGAVWVMVLLSDGAAGASDPVTRTGDYAGLSEPQPYNLVEVSGNFYNNPLNALGNNSPLNTPGDYPLPNEAYGVYGVCPYGSDAVNGELLIDTVPPYCMDLEPSTRTQCGTTAVNPALLRMDDYPLNCYQFYDVDDYARDWADWIGLSDLPGAVVDDAGTSRLSDQLLPTIFTIGFGLNFDAGTEISCGGDVACMRGSDPRGNRTHQEKLRQDYLGEELLRYIADVGDNFQIDADYWQAQISGRIGNAPPDWGARGACEETTPVSPANPGGTFQPVAPQQDCGNYFNASGGAELAEVFHEIASRMFTRLSG